MWASAAMVLVTVVPMFAPMIMGMAWVTESGLSAAATKPTMVAVVTEELCTSVVARMPTINAVNGFSVAVKNESTNGPLSASNPFPNPLTPTKKTYRSVPA